ncbi:DUF4913 domain-containing protein [Glutamicibacter bergerei]|uniref:DUF4913 domain-containing protein n=2 Tax=Glutamicibacter TaxID=1742989 RepID=A0ABV9MML8_9MICC|nr:DUF4913 domain-containing protein [Glutamicibacter sp. BW80]PCC29579.1 hypothetical protein CIK76_05745 [Glutamicibacter sp. BW80]HBV10440.1 DUF4913 domain-containing protein [Micrococcaceae bacterium]
MSFINDENLETTEEPEASAAEESEQPLAFETEEEWLTQWGLPNFRRRLNKGEFRWDPEWWRYEEAITLITALWLSFEKMRWDGATGMASYMRDYFYPLMGELTSPDGPFWDYDPPVREDVPAEWPVQTLPEDLNEGMN